MDKRRRISKEVQRKQRQAQARAQERRTRLLVIGGVVLLAIIAVVLVITLGSKPPQVSSAEYITVPTQSWPQATGKSMGPSNAKVVILEYADFQCPYCRQFHESIFQQIVDQYVKTGKARFEYHHFIVIDSNTGGNESHRAAEASECASDQGRFWDYFNMLFANQKTEGSGTFSDDRLKAFAGAIGLDTAKFNSCLDSGRDASRLTADQAQAVALGLQGTPTVIINGQRVQNPLDLNAVKTMIDTALQSSK